MDLTAIKKIFRMDQEQLLSYLKLALFNCGYQKINATKDYIIAEGNCPIILVAHLDTVFVAPPKEIYYDFGYHVMWSPQGLGADDRAGVVSILNIASNPNQKMKPHIIFTTDEELGGLGAQKLVIDIPECPFEDVKYIIELDRQGADDSVFYSCDNKEFEQYINSYGFNTKIGSFSDISIIAPKWGIAAVNLSIGYVDEHDEIERLYYSNTMMTISKVKKMIEASYDALKYEYIPITGSLFKGIPRCEWCGEPAIAISNTTKYSLCPECYKLFTNFMIDF